MAKCLLTAIDNVTTDILCSINQFNQATGLYVDVHTYKIKYLEALQNALIKDLENLLYAKKVGDFNEHM